MSIRSRLALVCALLLIASPLEADGINNPVTHGGTIGLGEGINNLGVGGTGGSSGTSYFNFTGSNLSHWLTAQSAVLAGTGNAEEADYGDSTTRGFYSNSTLSGLWSLSWPSQLAVLMTAHVNTKPDSIFGDGNLTTHGGSVLSYDTRLGLTGNWLTFTNGDTTLSSSTLGGYAFGNNVGSGVTPTDTLSFTPTNPIDSVDLWLLNDVAGSAINVNFDGGSNTTMTPSGGTENWTKYTFTGSLGSHTINLTGSGTIGIYVTGLMTYNSAVKQVMMANMGYGAATSTVLAANVNTYDPIPTLKTFAPNLTIIEGGAINDMLDGVPLLTSQANLQAQITAAKISGDVILLSPNPINPSQSGASLVQQAAYLTMMEGLATSNNVPLINLTAFFTSYAVANANGWMGDNNHPNQAGYAVIANAISNAPGYYVSGVTATFDPLNTDTAHINLINSNLTALGSGLANSFWGITRTTTGNVAGKFYSEYTITDDGSGGITLGVADSNQTIANNFAGGSTHSIGYLPTGAVYQNNALLTTIATYTNGSIVGVAVDIPNSLIWYRVGAGNWNNSGTANPATDTGGISFTASGTIYPADSIYNGDAGEIITANYGNSAYAHAAPAAYLNWVSGSGSSCTNQLVLNYSNTCALIAQAWGQ